MTSDGDWRGGLGHQWLDNALMVTLVMKAVITGTITGTIESGSDLGLDALLT